MGIVLDPWQRLVLDHMLAEDQDGNWCAFECALIVPRQNGKNEILVALELAAILLFGERTLTHSAHRYDTSLEHFLRMREVIEGSPDVLRKVARNGFVTTNGKEQIKFRSGQRIMFKARSNGAGRGFSGSRVVFDEAYDLPPKVLGNLIPTMSTRPNPQVIYTSSAAHKTSAVLHSLTSRVLNGDPGRLAYMEWGNEADEVTADELDLEAVARVNPAYGIRISEQYVRDEYVSLALAPAEFARERLGIAELPDHGKSDVKISLDAWSHCGEAPATWSSARVAEGQPVVLAVSAPTDRSTASVTMAGYRSDGLVHIEDLSLDDDGNVRPGVSWLKVAIPRMAKAWGAGLVQVVIDPKDPAASTVAEIEAELGEKLQRVTLERFAASCVDFVDMVHEGRIRHRGEHTYSESVAGLRVRTIGDGGLWLWDRLTSMSNPAPIISATLAVASLPAAVAARAPKPAETWAY